MRSLKNNIEVQVWQGNKLFVKLEFEKVRQVATYFNNMHIEDRSQISEYMFNKGARFKVGNDVEITISMFTYMPQREKLINFHEAYICKQENVQMMQMNRNRKYLCISDGRCYYEGMKYNDGKNTLVIEGVQDSTTIVYSLNNKRTVCHCPKHEFQEIVMFIETLKMIPSL